VAKDTQQRKERIIQAAIQTIQAHGVENASMRNVAEQAGLTTGAIYYHYKSKEELMFDVLNQSLHFSNRLADADIMQREAPEQVLEGIKQEVANRFRKQEEQVIHIQLMSEALSKDGTFREKNRANYTAIISQTADYFYKAYGIENEEQKKSVASFLIAAMDGIAIQQGLDVLPENLEETISRFNAFFGEAIGAYLKNTQS